MVPTECKSYADVLSQVAPDLRKHAHLSVLVLVPTRCDARRVVLCPVLVTDRHWAEMMVPVEGRAAVGALWDMIEQHLSRQEFPPSKRRLALRLDVSPTTLKNWQDGFVELPKRENLEAVADLIGKPYEAVLEAALSDTGYAKRSRPIARGTGRVVKRSPSHD